MLGNVQHLHWGCVLRVSLWAAEIRKEAQPSRAASREYWGGLKGQLVNGRLCLQCSGLTSVTLC